MSGFASEPIRTDERAEFAAVRNGASVEPLGQRHDRDDSNRGDSDIIKKRTLEGEIDISASQKMLSAVSGSLLTSLLGTN